MIRRRNRLAAALLACALAGGCASTDNRIPSRVLQAARSGNEDATRAFAAGNTVLALSLYRASLAQAQSIEDFELAGANLLNISLVHARLGQWADAHAAVDMVIAAPKSYGEDAAARAAARKALIHLDQGDAPAALRWADTAERGCAASCPFLATLANLRAHIALEQSQTEAAMVHATRAGELASKNSMDAERATAWRLLGRAHTRAGRSAEAALDLANALAMDRQLGSSAGIALDLLYAGDNEVRRQDMARAREFYERAAAVAEAAGNAAGLEAARSRLSALPR